MYNKMGVTKCLCAAKESLKTNRWKAGRVMYYLLSLDKLISHFLLIFVLHGNFLFQLTLFSTLLLFSLSLLSLLNINPNLFLIVRLITQLKRSRHKPKRRPCRPRQLRRTSLFVVLASLECHTIFLSLGKLDIKNFYGALRAVQPAINAEAKKAGTISRIAMGRKPLHQQKAAESPEDPTPTKKRKV